MSFLGGDDSTWNPERNDITVILTNLMRYLGLDSNAFCFFSLLMKWEFGIVTIPAFPFDATIWKAVARLWCTHLSMNEQFETVMLDFTPIVFTFKAPSTDVNLFL